MNEQTWTAPETEQEARVELAAAYRMAASMGWTDLGATHFSLRVPGEDDAYLMLQRGVLFHEVTASNLVKVGFDGEPRGAEQRPGMLNQAGITIHGAIQSGAPNVRAVLHTHTCAGVAVANHPDGLLPLSQHSMRFFARQGIHDYEGIAVDDDEGPRLVEHLADNELLLLRNHGLLTAGPTMPAAFSALYYAEIACQMQVSTLAGTPTPVMPTDDVCEHTAKQYEAGTGYQYRDWLALRRQVERDHPDYRDDPDWESDRELVDHGVESPWDRNTERDIGGDRESGRGPCRH